jgi:hypothetical protein
MLFLLFGCGDDDGGSPPVWTDAPAELSIGQGQQVSLPLTLVDEFGGTITVTPGVVDGLEAEVSADGTTLDVWAGYSIEGPVDLSVELADDGGNTALVTIPVTVAAIGWSERQTWSAGDGPEAREHGAFIIDEQGGRVLLFGGSGYSPYMDPLNDMWSYEPSTGEWTEITPSGDVPSGGGSRRVAQTGEEGVAYLHGGYGLDGADHGELYRLDFTGGDLVFTELAQQNAPADRALHAFAYDPGGDRFVMFGGVGAGVFGDTWLMTVAGDTGTWEEIELDPAPTPRYGFFFGFDTQRRRLILFSGAQGTAVINAAQDTWVLDLSGDAPVWEMVAEGDADNVPPGRRNGCMVFDPSGPRLFVFGGTPDAATTEPGLFAFDARPGKATWYHLELEDEPPVRSSGFGFYDAAGDQSFLGFGNTSTAAYADLTPLGY